MQTIFWTSKPITKPITKSQHTLKLSLIALISSQVLQSYGLLVHNLTYEPCVCTVDDCCYYYCFQECLLKLSTYDYLWWFWMYDFGPLYILFISSFQFFWFLLFLVSSTLNRAVFLGLSNGYHCSLLKWFLRGYSKCLLAIFSNYHWFRVWRNS